MLSSAQVRQATATQIVKHGSEFLLLYLRDQRSVPLSHSLLRSQVFNTLAAWKGLTRVNHAVTEAGAAGWGRLCLPAWLQEMGTSLGEGQSPSQIWAPQAGRGSGLRTSKGGVQYHSQMSQA